MWSLSFWLSHQNLVHIPLLSHFKWVPCHHDMACPQAADRGDGLQMWSVAANILNKQSRTADNGWLSSLGLGGGLTTPHRKNLYLLRSMYT
jgi:hypothetical protein